MIHKLNDLEEYKSIVTKTEIFNSKSRISRDRYSSMKITKKSLKEFFNRFLNRNQIKWKEDLCMKNFEVNKPHNFLDEQFYSNIFNFILKRKDLKFNEKSFSKFKKLSKSFVTTQIDKGRGQLVFKTEKVC